MNKNIYAMLLIVATLLVSCGETKKENYVSSVYLINPTLLGCDNVKSYSGMIEATSDISLGFKTPGEIEKIYVKEGDYVRKGELLAELDDSDYKLGVEALEIQYNQVKDEVSRIEKLYQQKSVSVNDYEKATAGLKQLAVQLQLNQNKLDYTKLYAPTDGYVQSVNFSPAEMVDAGTVLFKLLDVSQMEVVADIPVSEYQQRANFKEFYCSVAGVEDRIPLKLVSINPKADGNQLYRIKLTSSQAPAKILTAGMNVNLTIVSSTQHEKEQYQLPLSAIFKEEDKSYVWEFKSDSTISKQEVELSSKLVNGEAVIESGITPDMKIVRTGNVNLQQGEKVKPIQEHSKTNVGGLL